MEKTAISVVIPVRNEGANISSLVSRLANTLDKYLYELIFVVDASSDDTLEKLDLASKDYPVRVMLKVGPLGKAYSLLQGIKEARYEYVAMIDGDLQYPPEAISGMLDLAVKSDFDIVVGRRVHGGSLVRRFVSKTFQLMYKPFVGSMNVDIQSGLKVFKREIFDRIEIQRSTPWTFDFEFLLKSQYAGYSIGSYDITFEPRSGGSSKVRFLSTTYDILRHFALTLIRTSKHVPFSSEEKQKHGPGFYYKGQRYVTHNELHIRHTAVHRLSLWQMTIIEGMVVVVAGAMITNWHTALVTLISIATLMYFADMVFNMVLIYKSYSQEELTKIPEELLAKTRTWPKYTIFCPLYKESVILPQFVEAMRSLDYPKNKLQILLLLEEDDTETQAVAEAMKLPKYFEILVVPHSIPKTKPKACNYGLLAATGKFAVIYDAEDIPDPLQLKKAVLAFSTSGENVGCAQAKLNYYNPKQNLLTKLFTLEYSLWFDLVLTGLQAIGAPIPLGGTSNHFRVKDLRSFGGWDPFNVTEDADLGIRLSKRGYTTLIIDSTTYEEANSQLDNWLRQRSRWIKGYIQTYFVHNRRANALDNKRNFLIFQLVIGGKILSTIINPLFWLLTVLYFADRPQVGQFIEHLYPVPIYYLGIVTLVIGNFLYLYYYMVGAARRKQYSLILYALFIPLYWFLMSVASYRAVREFIVKPFHWHKTKHGLHLTLEKQPEAAEG